MCVCVWLVSFVFRHTRRLRRDYENELKKTRDAADKLAKQLRACEERNVELESNEARMKDELDGNDVKVNYYYYYCDDDDRVER